MGRPTKEFNERRAEQLNIRVTPDERAQLDRTAAIHGLTTTEFVRRRSLDYQLTPSVRRRQPTALIATALIRIGVNLNQALRHANAGWGGLEDQLRLLIDRINAELDKLYGPETGPGGPVL